MRKIRRLQLVFGLVWGSLVFLAGVAGAYYAVGGGLISETPRWKTAAWVFLGANGVGVEWSQLGGNVFATQRVNLLSEYPSFSYLRVFPIGLSLLGGLLVSDSIGYSKRPRHIVENCLSVVTGYVVAGGVTLYVSNAQPSFEAIVLLLLVSGLALFIGGVILSQIGGSLAFIGVASIWAVLFIGLVAIGGGIIIVHTFAPLVLYPSGGALLGATLLIVARKVRI